MIKKIVSIMASVSIVVVFWYLLGEFLVLKDNTNSISKLQCVSYAPFSKDQAPRDFDDGMVITEDAVRKDLAMLSKYTDCIRTYSTVGLEMIPKIARENGLKMLMGGWVSSDKLSTELELNTLIKLAKENEDVVKAVIVGNEVLLRGDTTDSVLSAYIKDVKKALPNTQVTYADVWEFWLKYPKVREATDFVTIHILPYWEDNPMDVSSAIAHVVKVREEVEGILQDKNILIGETGWPSEGRMREDALPSKINQAIFIREFVKIAEQKNWKYNIIEAFDQPWKRLNEGAVGGFWGLFDKDRVDKHVFSGDVSNFPNNNFLASISIFLVLLFSILLKDAKNGNKEIVYFSGINTVFAVLFALQIEQYNITVRTYSEFLWAAVVVITNLLIYYFLLFYIAQNRKPQILSIRTIIKKKLVSFDATLMLLFYISFILLLISSINLAFDGRYRNFEVYIYLISIISIIWLYKGMFKDMDFGKFEKATTLVLAFSSFLLFINESYLNIFADVWILISLGFVYITLKGSQKIQYKSLCTLGLYMLSFFVFFALIRFGFMSNSYFLTLCNTSIDSFICMVRTYLGEVIYIQIFGAIAIVMAVVALFANKKSISLVALFFSVGALLLFNANLGSFAFVLSIFMLTKIEDKSEMNNNS